MRNSVAIAWLRMKLELKSPSGIILMFVMPLLFSLIFGNMSGGEAAEKPVVLVVGADESPEIAALMKKNSQYKWQDETSDQAIERVKDQTAIAAVSMAEDPQTAMSAGEPLFEIFVQRKDQAYASLQVFLEGVANTAAASISMTEPLGKEAFSGLLKGVADREDLDIQKKTIQHGGEEKEASSLITLGFTIMFMMFAISGAASSILDERKEGTWQRLLLSPATKGQILLGYLGSYFVLGWIQLSVLMGTTTLIFQSSWGNLLYFIPFASLIILTIAGYGLMMASVVKTSQQAAAVNAVIIVSTCMLGGVYWSLDIVPEAMQTIAKFVPQSWMMQGLTEIISGSLHAVSIASAVFVLIGFCAVFYTVGIKKMQFH